ncbi:MAG: hypothetical protein MUF58_23150 [Arcicella sp.]|jgi:hypothetical protein|nr:hypothetical protein [Arcicella sp.]
MQVFEIPQTIDESEEIVRVLLSPIHINKTAEIKPYAFQPPANSEDISVNRLFYTTLDICKKQGLIMQNDRNLFWGLGIASVKNIKQVGFDIAYSPIQNHPKYADNLSHSDIKIGYIKQEGEPLPIDITLKIKELIRLTQLEKDPNPTLEVWNH